MLSLLQQTGAEIDTEKSRVFIPGNMIDTALSTVPGSFKLFNAVGEETNNFSGDNIHFTPGSSALTFLDPETNQMRKPGTADYIRYVKVVDQLKHIASQSTAMIPSDIADEISDSYRLFLSLLYSGKPVVTGTFSTDAFKVMKNMLIAVRGSEEKLKEKPLAMFTACPTSPLKWSKLALQNIIDCGNFSIPVEIVSMPLAGFIAPVTLVGTLIQHTAELLSGIVIAQLYNPGTPLLYGGSPAVFDVRYETTPMGAIETMMIDCAYNEIGKYLGLPTQAYVSLTDSKQLDVQAGLETGMGATLAALAGINNMSGPGMIDFENCHSIEKLVIDNEICGMIFRMVKGIEPKDDFPSLSHFQELMAEEHLLISKHSRKHLRAEHYFPGPVINRANNARWIEDGSTTMEERASQEVEKYIKNYSSNHIPDEIKEKLITLMETEANRFGQNKLPERN